MYDVLLPTVLGAQPILLPQPPAYVPTLFAQEHLNVQLLSMPPATYITALPAPHRAVTEAGADASGAADDADAIGGPAPFLEGEAARNLSAVDVFAMSSDHCPLLVLAPRHKPDELLGGHVVQDAVRERIPYLLDQGNDRGTIKHSVPEDNDGEDSSPAATEAPAEVDPARFHPLWVAWAWMWNRWWFWSLMLIVGFSILLIVFDRRLRVLSELQQAGRAVERRSVEGRVSVERAQVNGYAPVANGDAAPEPKIQPADPEKGDAVEHVEDAVPPAINGNATGKKPNGRRRKRGKRRGNKDGVDKDASEDEDEDELLVVSGESKANDAAGGAGPSDANDAVTITVRAAKREGASMEGLTISEEVLGEHCASSRT